MRICIVGPGAIGCLFGASLAKSGNDVMMIDRHADRAELIGSRGIVMTGISGDFTVAVDATVETTKTRNAELVMICVKSYDTAGAVAGLPRALPEDCAVLTLQNGLGNVELIAERFGPERSYAGTTALGATLLGPGHVRHSGKGVTTVGRFKGAPDARVDKIVDALNKAGFETHAVTDVTVALWNKVVVNAAVNPLTALTGVRNGRLVEIPEARELLALVVRECAQVARTQGVTDDPLPRVEEICRKTAQNVSSMLQDILRGKQPEISAINAAVVKEAERQGIPAPVNAVLAELVGVLAKKKPFWQERRKREYGLDQSPA
jgi:2-dehydropantoate 2-reductase